MKKKRYRIERTETLVRVWYVAAFTEDEAALMDYLAYEPLETETHWGPDAKIVIQEEK